MTDTSKLKNSTSMYYKYKVCPGIVLTSLGSHYYLCTPSSYMELNESAVFYWKCLEDGANKEDLIKTVYSRYEIQDPDLVRSDIDLFIRICMEKHLIEAVGEENEEKPEHIS